MQPQRPHGWLAIGLFLLAGSALATLAGITLCFPGTLLDSIWRLNPKGYAGLHALGRAVRVIFFVLGAALTAAGIGWLRMRLWGWILAVLLIGVNALGDAIRLMSGSWFEGGLGVVIAGVFLLYLISPGVRSAFRAVSAPAPPDLQV